MIDISEQCGTMWR